MTCLYPLTGEVLYGYYSGYEERSKGRQHLLSTCYVLVPVCDFKDFNSYGQYKANEFIVMATAF